MATATERIPVLVTSQEKQRIAALAKASGVSMGEYLRRAADSYAPAEEEALLDGMIDQVLKATEQASAAIDEALRFVDESDRRIAALDARKAA